MKKLDFRIKELNGKFTVQKKYPKYITDNSNIFKYIVNLFLISKIKKQDGFKWLTLNDKGYASGYYTIEETIAVFNTKIESEKFIDDLLEEPKYYYFN